MGVKLPKVLSFERKLETSDAFMFAGDWGTGEQPKTQEWEIIQITKRQNRSTQSAYGISDDKKSQPNPVSSDSDDANLPHGRDTLKVNFSMRIIGNVGAPFSCDSPDFIHRIKQKMEDYRQTNGLKTLAFRYAYNIVNGRFLWRNRVCAENVVIEVTTDDPEKALIFKAYDFSLNNFKENCHNKELQKLAGVILKGLEGGSEDFNTVEVDAYVKLGSSQHVFPSQEMNMGEKKKILFKLPVDGKECAAMHNVKIGNAIRTIDSWYQGEEDSPIAVEPYGSVTQRGKAFRKSKNDLYTLMLKWVNDEAVIQDDKNYIVANFIRGGVFGGKSE